MKKKEWHRIHKPIVRGIFNGCCNKCSEYLHPSNGVVHHKTYRHEGGIYNAAAQDLIELGKIEYLCHDCHTYTHETESIDGITRILPITSFRGLASAGTCCLCNSATRQSELDENEMCLSCQNEDRNTCGDCGEWSSYELDENHRCEICANSYRQVMESYQQ